MINLSQLAIQNNGTIKPLLISSQNLSGPSLMNPSILLVNNRIFVNLRNINYVLYHSETQKNEHAFGPLCYLHPENNLTLTTYNILCELNNNLDIIGYTKVDTSFLDTDPLWEFVGLEDCRLVYWDNRLLLSGVRRDTSTNGQGRIELSEISFKKLKTIEINRQRIPAPPPDTSYCEKNWMPILDKPYHFIKWTNPTELVKYNPLDRTCETAILKDYKFLDSLDLRGGSQVIPYKDYYLAIVHETYLYKSEAGRKDGSYYHRFVVWDKNFNILHLSPRFTFMGAKIEFCCGLCEYENNFLITFGFQDNASFILSIPKFLIEKELLYI